MADLARSQEVQVNFFAKTLYFCKDSSINDVYISDNMIYGII